MSIILTNEMMQRSAAKLAEIRISAQPSLDEFDHEFSPQFEQAMEKLLMRSRQKIVWRKTATAAAFFLVVLLIGAGIFLALNQNVRASFVTWLREQYENSIIYHFLGGGGTSEFPVYQIGSLPEGFELLQEFEEDTSYIAFYQSNGGADQIIFTYAYGKDWDDLIISGNVSSARQLTIQGLYGEYIPYGGSQAGDLIWIDENRQLVFTLSSTLELYEIIEIAESVFLKK